MNPSLKIDLLLEEMLHDIAMTVLKRDLRLAYTVKYIAYMHVVK